MHELHAPALAGRTLAPAGSTLVLAEVADPGGGNDPPTYIAPLHVHHADDEAWYVLEGALRFVVGDDEVQVDAGGAIVIPRETPHTFWNPSPSPARYVLVMTPTIRALIDALHPTAGRVARGPVPRAREHADPLALTEGDRSPCREVVSASG